MSYKRFPTSSDEVRRLRYVWPQVTRCMCGSSEWSDAGRANSIAYRRCTACGEVYAVRAIAQHVDRGGLQSRLEPL